MAYGPITETWTIAPARLSGTIYYNSYGTQLAQNSTGAVGGNGKFGGAVLSIHVGDTAPKLVAGTSATNPSGCRVCHSVAALRLAARRPARRRLPHRLRLRSHHHARSTEHVLPAAISTYFPAPGHLPGRRLARAHVRRAARASAGRGACGHDDGPHHRGHQPRQPGVLARRHHDRLQPARRLPEAGPDALRDELRQGHEHLRRPHAHRPGDEPGAARVAGVLPGQQVGRVPPPDPGERLRQPRPRVVTRSGARSQLYWVDLSGPSSVTPLDQLNGKGYLPKLAQTSGVACTDRLPDANPVVGGAAPSTAAPTTATTST